LTIKGAPDILIGRCTHYVDQTGGVSEFDSAARARVEDIKNKWSASGSRVILLARKIIRKGEFKALPHESDHEKEVSAHAAFGLVLVGLVGIVDPPRPEIPEVVQILRRAGIRIFMVSISAYGSSDRIGNW
jgi:sodium/potassium-transporting ATPase subunit alpha